MPRPSKKKGEIGGTSSSSSPSTSTNKSTKKKMKTHSNDYLQVKKERLSGRDKPPRRSLTPRPKPILIPGTDNHYTDLTLEEYYAYEEAIEKFLTSGGPGDGGKSQNASLCNEYFPLIKETNLELADYALVEPLEVSVILEGGCWLHMNFTAKHKDEDDCSKAVYFAEVCTSQMKVTCLAKLDNDSLESRDTQCNFCHVDLEKAAEPFFPGAIAGFVHHPEAGFIFARNKVVASS